MYIYIYQSCLNGTLVQIPIVVWLLSLLSFLRKDGERRVGDQPRRRPHGNMESIPRWPCFYLLSVSLKEKTDEMKSLRLMLAAVGSSKSPWRPRLSRCPSLHNLEMTWQLSAEDWNGLRLDWNGLRLDMVQEAASHPLGKKKTKTSMASMVLIHSLHTVCVFLFSQTS